MQDNQELLEIDVKDQWIKEAEVGEDGLNLYIVAPARFHYKKYENIFADNAPIAHAADVDNEAAHSQARRFAANNKQDYCVYKLVTISRFSYKGPND